MSTSRPERTCVGCRRHDDPAAMVRHVLNDGVLVADPLGRAPGRGAWVHPNPDCWNAAVSRGGFARSFRSQVRGDVLPSAPFGE